MASISIEYTSATSYTVTASGLTAGQKYHIFTDDLDTSGNITGYVCRYTQTASSSSWSETYSTSSAYSGYNRHAYMYCTGTTATSHSVGVTYTASQLPTGITGSWSAYDSWSGSGASSYRILLKRGSGISSIAFYVNGTGSLYTLSNASSMAVEVGSGGYLYLSSISYEDDYTYPVYATDQTSTPYSEWTVIGSGGSWSDRYISAPSSSGTRTVNISATYAPTYYYQIKAHGVSGTFPDGSTYWLSAVRYSATSYITYAASNIPTPTREGYTFLGWSVSSSSTTTVSTISFTATSTSSASPTTKEVWAVWEKKSIELFYWQSASADATLIAKGKPITNITAARWNKLKAKIRELRLAQGSTWSYSEVTSGASMTAGEFNVVRSAISGCTGYTTLPAAQSGGNAVKAALFEGDGSLKSALNGAITYYNNS